MSNDISYDRKKEDSKISKIVVDRDLCIGAAPCIALAPQTFDLDDEGKAVVIDPNLDDDGTLMDAAMSCPVLAIKLYDQDGNMIYP